MESRKIIIILSFIFLPLLHGVAQVPEDKELSLLVRHQSYPSYTRIVIEGDEETLKEAKVLRIDPGLQFLVEFKKKAFLLKPSTLSINDGLVKSVEFIEKGDKNVLNIILEKAPHDYKSFFLKNPPRRVIDIYKSPLDPSSYRAVIVIDPGHGGSDEGAKGQSGLLEKVLTLDIALRLKTLLQKNPEIKVILTRSSDTSLSLRERAFIGNSNKADLFISLHGSSSFGKPKKDFIIYLLLHRESREEERNPYLWDIQHERALKESKALAESLKESIKKVSGEEVLIKEAPLLGLMGIEAPSVLIEIPLIPVEEKKLQNESYKNRIASNIMEGIINYIKKRSVAGRNSELKSRIYEE